MIDVTLPKWGATMQEATVTKWLVAAGDSVSEGDAIAQIETEKVDADLESPATGVVAEILVAAGMTVPVGELLARIETS
jgi:pyruvate/2-oxoglutarate dehydrogenase complex dihydrolipoamide acyltransferase (E2) component